MKRKIVRLFAIGMTVMMFAQMPVVPVRAAQADVAPESAKLQQMEDEMIQDTVEAKTYEAVTAASGDFGENKGLHWKYDIATKTVTVSGDDIPGVMVVWEWASY